MPADRTTLRATVDELLELLRDGLIADPPTATKPFRHVIVGSADGSERARPFLTVSLVRARAIATTDGDKLIEASATIRAVTDVRESDAHGPLLDCVAAVDDFLDSLIDTGVIDGAEGFDDRVWSFDQPQPTAGPQLALATASWTFVVKVARGQNRVPV
jgi:hypothetical protein